MRRETVAPATAGQSAHFWPPFLDLVTSALMVFVLVGFVDTALRPEALKAVLLRQAQDRFLADLQREMAPEIGEGALRVERNFDFIQITFSDRVLFDSGDHRLRSGGRRLLARSVRVFQGQATEVLDQVQVEGHTDSLPVPGTAYPSDNWELSTARAIEVVRFLISQGLPAEVFSANGYADQRPVASNSHAAGRARNRRIELRVFFSVEGEEGKGR